MEIEVAGSVLPSLEELKRELTEAYLSRGYVVSEFGWGAGKSLIVKKSTFVGVRIFSNPRSQAKPLKPKIRVDGFFGDPWAGMLLGGIILIAFFWSDWQKLTKDIHGFLESKYGVAQTNAGSRR